MAYCRICFFFFFNDTATTEIYTLSLHDALPIYRLQSAQLHHVPRGGRDGDGAARRVHLRSADHRPVAPPQRDRKSTRLNSSHGYISYAVFCLKKKKFFSLYSLPWNARDPRSRHH